METEQNQPEFDNLEKVEQINEGVLNTPAKEPKITQPVIDQDQQLKTFMQFNKLPQVKTDQGIVLDLAGEKAAVNEGQISKETTTNLFGKITGNDLQVDEPSSGNALFIIVLISVGLFAFLLMNFKRTEEMGKLQEEINKLKNKTGSII